MVWLAHVVRWLLPRLGRILVAFVPRLARSQQEAVPQLADGLREIHLHATVVDEHVVHLLVGLHARRGGLELDERVVERVPGLVVADYLAGLDGPESREDQLEVLVGSYWVQLGDEQHLLGRLHVCVREVPGHLQHDRAGLRLLAADTEVELFGGLAVRIILDRLGVDEPPLDALLLGVGALGRGIGNDHAGQVGEGVVEDIGVYAGPGRAVHLHRSTGR